MFNQTETIAGRITSSARRRIAVTSLLVFTCSACAAYAQTAAFSVLYTFTGGADGGNPDSAPIQDRAGNLYGTAGAGGDAGCGVNRIGCGVVYRLSPTGAETALFTPTKTTGQVPIGGVKQDTEGSLFGVTGFGVKYPGGTIYKLSSAGVETTLHQFRITPGANGYYPDAGLVGDAAGNLYGTASSGGSVGSFGVVFQLNAEGTYSVLHVFQGPPNDGAFPASGLIRDSAGNLYGTTLSGGTDNYGTLYRIDPSGDLTILHNFAVADGVEPGSGNLTMDGAGNLYGVAPFGGNPFSNGTVFKVSATGEYTKLYQFHNGADGSEPVGTLVFVPAVGYLFGTASRGGSHGLGTVFAVNVATGEEHSLYEFTGGNDGANPVSGLLGVPTSSNTIDLYGTASAGGAPTGCNFGCGTVFKLSVSQ